MAGKHVSSWYQITERALSLLAGTSNHTELATFYTNEKLSSLGRTLAAMLPKHRALCWNAQLSRGEQSHPVVSRGDVGLAHRTGRLPLEPLIYAGPFGVDNERRATERNEQGITSKLESFRC